MGVRHQQANVFWRGRLSFEEEESQCFIAEVLRTARAEPEASGFLSHVVVLHTCNRSEWYLVAQDTLRASAWLLKHLMRAKQIAEHEMTTLKGLMFQAHHMEAVFHLCRVASGLDSLVMGEDQVLGQVREAWLQAKQRGEVDDILEKTFQLALQVGKMVRTETGISRRSQSVAHAMFALANRHAQARSVDFQTLPVVVLGAGKMADILLHQLCQKRVGLKETHHTLTDQAPIWVINRHKKRVAQMMLRYPSITTGVWETLPELLNTLTTRYGEVVVFVATGAPHPVLHLKHVSSCAKDTLHIYDLALPRNTHADLDTIPQGAVYHLDHLGEVYQQFTEEQEAIQSHALVLIHEAWQRYEQWWLLRPYRQSFALWRSCLLALGKQCYATAGGYPEGIAATTLPLLWQACWQEVCQDKAYDWVSSLFTTVMMGHRVLSSRERFSKPSVQRYDVHRMMLFFKQVCLELAKTSSSSEVLGYMAQCMWRMIQRTTGVQVNAKMSGVSVDARLLQAFHAWQLALQRVERTSHECVLNTLKASENVWHDSAVPSQHTRSALPVAASVSPVTTEAIASLEPSVIGSKCPFARTVAYAIAMQAYVGEHLKQLKQLW
jgi:glutamyl-tRNA reductase